MLSRSEAFPQRTGNPSAAAPAYQNTNTLLASIMSCVALVGRNQSTKMSSGRTAETMQFGTSTSWPILRSTAAAATA